MRNAEKKKKVGQNVLNSEVGPGVVLLVAELCRGYRCGSRKKKKWECGLRRASVDVLGA
jgi:hypothetical protein